MGALKLCSYQVFSYQLNTWVVAFLAHSSKNDNWQPNSSCFRGSLSGWFYKSSLHWLMIWRINSIHRNIPSITNIWSLIALKMCLTLLGLVQNKRLTLWSIEFVNSWTSWMVLWVNLKVFIYFCLIQRKFSPFFMQSLVVLLYQNTLCDR